MKVTKIFMMAALAAMTAACSNDDRSALPLDPVKNDLGQQSAGVNGEITITATLEAADGAKTRALSDPDGENKIQSTWETTDEFAILYKNGTEDTKSIATVKSINASTVTITFTIPATLADNTACKIVYPASAANAANTDADVATALATQDGVLATAPDIRVGTATINKTTHSLESVTKLEAKNAIFKFTVQDLGGTAKSASEFVVSDNAGNIITTVTLATAASEFYVALPDLTAGTYWFSATADSKPYIAKGTVGTATTAGNYYQTTVKMATLGDLMGQNGKFYADAAAITAASTTAIGVIAHIGTDATTEAIANGGGHGLVLCLKNAVSGDDAQWSTETSAFEFGEDAKVADVTALKRTTNVSGYTNTKTLAEKTDAATKYKAAYAAKNYTVLAAPAGTTGWFLPSAQQWVKMIEGLGALEESSITWGSWFDTSHTAADKWEAALSKAGSGNYVSMTSAYLYYWSSSECYANYAVNLRVDATGTGEDYGFRWDLGGKAYSDSRDRVRPVLAF